MNILITGFNGFIGRHLTRRLIADGHNVYGIDNFSTSSPDLSWIPNAANIENFYNVDIRDLKPVERRTSAVRAFYSDLKDVQIDCVIHLAALARVQASFNDVIEWSSVNVTGTLNVLELCKSLGCNRFINASSSSVYGFMSPPSRNLEVWQEDTESELDPKSPYALQKLIAEKYCKLYERWISTVISLRFFNVYGEDQPAHGSYPQAIPIFLHQKKTGKPFTIYGDGSNMRDFTYVGDIVEGIVKCLTYETSPYKGNGIFNLGTGESYSVIDIKNAIDRNHPVDWLPERDEPKLTIANITKAQSLLDWDPVERVTNWIKTQI
jgi:nucleoside-diphosphate-sugar epimerase